MYSIKNVKASNHPYRPLYALSKFLGVQGSFVFWCGFFFFLEFTLQVIFLALKDIIAVI